MIELKWEEFTGIEKQTGEDITFNVVPGHSRQALQAEGISEHFNLFIPKVIVEEWVTETNRYARECEQSKPSKTKWVDVCYEELLAFLRMVIAMGLISLPSVRLLHC